MSCDLANTRTVLVLVLRVLAAGSMTCTTRIWYKNTANYGVLPYLILVENNCPEGRGVNGLAHIFQERFYL